MVYNSPTAASCGFACGLMSGLGQSAMFNSYDRAMYYSIVNRRPFLNAENWKGNPFTGISPSFLQRSFSAGLYFPLEDVFRYHVSSNHAIDGVLVGLVGGFLTTPFNTVKYAMWSHNSSIGKSTQPGLIATANALLRDGGFPRLMRGVVPTLYRDMTFGLTFSLLRHQGDNGFGINAGAAFLGTVLSSPFNYARMRIYGHSSGPRRVGPILREWVAEVVAHGSMVDRIKFACSSLNVGWGALRVSLGMGIGSQIYNACWKLCY